MRYIYNFAHWSVPCLKPYYNIAFPINLSIHFILFTLNLVNTFEGTCPSEPLFRTENGMSKGASRRTGVLEVA